MREYLKKTGKLVVVYVDLKTYLLLLSNNAYTVLVACDTLKLAKKWSSPERTTR
jgi:hypothetical protein